MLEVHVPYGLSGAKFCNQWFFMGILDRSAECVYPAANTIMPSIAKIRCKVSKSEHQYPYMQLFRTVHSELHPAGKNGFVECGVTPGSMWPSGKTGRNGSLERPCTLGNVSALPGRVQP